MSGLEIFAIGVIAWWTIKLIVPGLENYKFLGWTSLYHGKGV